MPCVAASQPEPGRVCQGSGLCIVRRSSTCCVLLRFVSRFAFGCRVWLFVCVVAASGLCLCSVSVRAAFMLSLCLSARHLACSWLGMGMCVLCAVCMCPISCGLWAGVPVGRCVYCVLPPAALRMALCSPSFPLSLPSLPLPLLSLLSAVYCYCVIVLVCGCGVCRVRAVRVVCVVSVCVCVWCALSSVVAVIVICDM